MDVGAVIKECGEVYGRLFDHKPVVRGEINFFLREFEEKRGNREYMRLQKALDDCREITDSSLPSVVQQLGDNVRTANRTLVEATAACQNVLSKEGQSQKNEWRVERQEERSSEWSEFVDKMCERCNRVDEEFATEVKHVEDYYRELEQKMMKDELPSHT